MERLTFEGNFCDIAQCAEVRGGSFCEGGACYRRKVWEQLKAYEDTGLTPEGVRAHFIDGRGVQILIGPEICEWLDAERLKWLIEEDLKGNVEGVVRCRDCVHCLEAEFAGQGKVSWCGLHGKETEADGYCSYRERAK